mmetsp:Transcript_87285/g.233733  ORF Transcript_87285/g.233733 Transcript_87285/m.233733 type:complete len:196 (+) Transcript_87285:32-619(+)
MAQAAVRVEVAAAVTHPEGHVVYPVKVSALSAFGDVWELQKRYSELSALNDDLKKRFPHSPLPVFPRKHNVSKYLRHESEDEFLEERRAQLEKYLQTLVQLQFVQDDPQVRSFLEIDKHAVDPKAKAKSVIATCCEAIREMLAGDTRTPEVELASASGIAGSAEARKEAAEMEKARQQRAAEREKLRQKYNLPSI